MMQRFSYLFVCTIAFLSLTQAELLRDYGVVGTTFEILEEDLLEVIERKLKIFEAEGSLHEHQQKIIKQAQERIKSPKPVAGIKHTKEPRSFTYDPSIIIPYALKDHQGKIFHVKGTKINPLDYQSLTKFLLFIDGENQPQVEWAMSQQPVAQIILTNGSPFEVMEKLDRSVYFDQEGALTKKLGIQQVPARVTQQDKHLLIEEINLHKEG
ncbi:MAG: type-F conjugative transfer system protein TraW, partial [Alphaproteobacteria bacterium]|nr:type-F conjugative transfer system protein TraW [Alphaproteobacteria bacterium]